MPENQIYAAFVLACEHSTTGCIDQMTVSVRLQGATYNVTVPGSVQGVGFPRTLPNPFRIAHPVPSYYTWSPIHAGHIVPTGPDEVEAHYDAFNPWFLFPLHMGEWLAGMITGSQQTTWTCSVVGGCTPSP